MKNLLRALVWGCALLAAGCSPGSPDAPTLAPADGTITYQGKPLAGATVTFAPEKGPLAQAITDLNGKFTLATGALPGAAVGPVKVSVSAFPPGQGNASGPKPDMKPYQTREEGEAYRKMAREMSEAPTQSRSLIPEKYAKVDTSGLTFTIKPGGDNHFPIELKD